MIKQVIEQELIKREIPLEEIASTPEKLYLWLILCALRRIEEKCQYKSTDTERK